MKKRHFFYFIIFFVVLSILFYFFLDSFNQAADSYAGSVAKTLLTYRIYESLNENIKHSGLKYDDFAFVAKDRNGKITAIQVDSVKLNIIASELILTVIESINCIQPGEFYIPLGNALHNRLLAGKGPKINVKVNLFGTIANDIKSVFKSAGINQSLHRIMLDFKVCVKLMTPFSEAMSDFSVSLCIAETVIVGEVPNVIWGTGYAPGQFEGYD